MKLLLGAGRKDESGDFTKGAGLDEGQINRIIWITLPSPNRVTHRDNLPESIAGDMRKAASANNYLDNRSLLDDWFEHEGENRLVAEAISELMVMASIFAASGYGTLRILIDPSCVRGLEYYTGMVYEAELLFDVPNEKGEKVVFGSVGGGGRYDGLVKRFTGQDVPATGFSIGVSRLMTALKNLGKLEGGQSQGPVVVCVMDKDVEALGDYMNMVQELRAAGIRAEMFQGNPKQFGKQLQYADRRGSPVCIIAGSDERARGMVQIKDMIEGRRQAEAIESNEDYRAARVGQFEIARADLVNEVARVLNEQSIG